VAFQITVFPLNLKHQVFTGEALDPPALLGNERVGCLKCRVRQPFQGALAINITTYAAFTQAVEEG
jgi:hypothetical protein